MNRKILVYANGFIFVLGLGCLFMPHLFRWSEVALPAAAGFILIPYLLWPLLFGTAVGLLFLSASMAFLRKWPRLYKLLPLGLAVLLCVVRYGAGYVGVDYYPVAGQTRVWWAGGAEKVTSAGRALLEVTSETDRRVSPEVWPETISRLGVISVWVVADRQGLGLSIPLARGVFASDHFGYLISAAEISDVETLGENFLNPTGGYRIWELDQGLFFFEEW